MAASLDEGRGGNRGLLGCSTDPTSFPVADFEASRVGLEEPGKPTLIEGWFWPAAKVDVGRAGNAGQSEAPSTATRSFLDKIWDAAGNSDGGILESASVAFSSWAGNTAEVAQEREKV